MITQIRMVNCQSWKDASFSLALDRLNVIEAPNSTGKSVLFKMLKITASPSYFDKVEREKLIRWGAQYASIIYAFDSGGAGAVKVYKEQPVYFYKRSGGGWEQSLAPSPEMLKEAGLLADGDFIANIVDTDQDLLLVNPNLSSNYSLIRMLTYNEELENLKDRLAVLQPKFRDYVSATANKAGFYERQLSSVAFRDVEGLRQTLGTLRVAKELMFQLIDSCNMLQGIKSVLQYYKDYKKLLSAVELLQKLETVELKGLAVRKKPVDASFAALLEGLEAVRLSGIMVVEEPVDAELAVLLAKLESVKLSDLVVGKEPLTFNYALLFGECIKLRENFASLSNDTGWMAPLPGVLEGAESLQKSLAELAESGKRVEEFEHILKSSGDLVACPIHGEVVYNGHECLPCSV